MEELERRMREKMKQMIEEQQKKEKVKKPVETKKPEEED